MSSLAASRADNFYFPPEYDGRKHGGLSKFNNPGYKGSNQWQQSGVVRWELPFDGWCVACKRHMSKGLRFNAKKEKAGKYFTTTIFSFSMKCPSCPQQFEIKTDPKNSTYDFAVGIRKMEQEYETGAEDRVITLTSDETKQQLQEDAIFKLEFDNEKKAKEESAKQRIEGLIERNESTNRHDYDMNKKMREKNRTLKRRQKDLVDMGASIGLAVPLLENDEADITLARRARFKPRHGGLFGASERVKMTNIQEQSIFATDDYSSKRKRRKNEDGLSVRREGRVGGEGRGERGSMNESAVQKQARLMIDIQRLTKAKYPERVQISRGDGVRSITSVKKNNSEETASSSSTNGLTLLAGYEDDF